jgi:hypothetical protein
MTAIGVVPVPTPAEKEPGMESSSLTPEPSGHTPDGGWLVGSEGARHRMVLFEDPQCPYCRQFEETSGDTLRREVAAGGVAVEYRMRSFLGVESVRADNALALAAEGGRFDDLRRQMFAAQPVEGTGGYSAADLIDLGRRAAVTGPDYERGVREGRYEQWVVEMDQVFQTEDPHGTPAAFIDGEPVDLRVLYDPPALQALLRS